jgi:acyl carrier protein
MTIEIFINELEQSIVGAAPGSLKPATRFRELPYWDSLAALTTLAVFDASFGRQLSGQQLTSCTTIQHIYDLAHAK